MKGIAKSCLPFLLQLTFIVRGIQLNFNVCRRNANHVEVGRQCQKPCSDDLGCPNPYTHCLCDDACGMSCINPRIPCGYLKQPDFGYISIQNYRFRSAATYSCYPGYTLNGHATRKCRSDGKWSRRTPECVPYSACGQTNHFSNNILPQTLTKVIHGNNAPAGAWPWMAMIVKSRNRNVYKSLKYLVGGATIINNKWLITGGHLFGSYNAENQFTNWLSKFYIATGIVGMPKLGKRLSENVQVFQVGKLYRHPKYNSANFDYDVSLISLGKRVKQVGNFFVVDQNSPSDGIMTFTKFVRPVCLPCISQKYIRYGVNDVNKVSYMKVDYSLCESINATTQPRNDDLAVVTGFGVRNPASIIVRNPRLRQGILQILPREKCNEGIKRIQYEWSKASFTSSMLCADSVNPVRKVDACVGDSGGPLVQKRISKSGYSYWEQVGIVSWGWGCSSKAKDGFSYPGYFTDVKSIAPWIIDTTSSNETLDEAISRGLVRRKTIKIFRLITGQVYEVDMKENLTVKDLKERLESQHGLKTNSQRLFHNRRILTDTVPVSTITSSLLLHVLSH